MQDEVRHLALEVFCSRLHFYMNNILFLSTDMALTQIGWLQWTQMSTSYQWETIAVGNKSWTMLIEMKGERC